MAKQVNNLIEYSLKSVQVNRYNYSLPKIKVADEAKIALDYNINPIVKYNLKDNLILIFLQVEIVIKETNEKIVDSEIAFIYGAKNLNSFVELIDKTQIWKFKDEKNEGLIVTLIGISLSTARGILFEKTRGTIAEGAPLPIMNPASFVKKAE